MCNFDQQNLYYSDDSFLFLDSWYERDVFTGRCYRMEPSISLRREMDGAQVKRRISKDQYRAMLRGLRRALNERKTFLLSIQ